MTNELVQLNETGDVPVTTSLLVAEAFGKEHKSVMRSIKTIVSVLESNKIGGCNFALVNYTGSNGQARPMFEMDKDDNMVKRYLYYRGKDTKKSLIA